jgi:hypothetical protein
LIPIDEGVDVLELARYLGDAAIDVHPLPAEVPVGEEDRVRRVLLVRGDQDSSVLLTQKRNVALSRDE